MSPLRFFLGLALLAGLADPSCSKKRKGESDKGYSIIPSVTEAKENAIFNWVVQDADLAIRSLDVLALGQPASPLRLSSDEYSTDRAHFSVRDPSLEALSNATGIICLLNQAAYTQYVGAGAYLAQADASSCLEDGGGSLSLSRSSGVYRKRVTMTIESKRTSTRHPLVVNAWYAVPDSSDPALETYVRVKLLVAEGQSPANPLGIFNLDWQRGPEDGDPVQKGYIKVKRSAESGAIMLTSADQRISGDKSYLSSAAATLTYDAASETVVSGILHSQKAAESVDAKTSEFAAAFNASRLLRRDVKAKTESCLAKNAFDYHIERYGLYDSKTGTRHSTTGLGFPVAYTDELGMQRYGWADYWGVWLDHGVSASAGMSVQSIDPISQARTDYVVRTGPGKLLKKTKRTVSLDKIAGMEMEAYDAQGIALVSYEAATKSFVILKRKSFVDGKEVLTAASGAFSLRQAWQADAKVSNVLYAEGLGGEVVIYSDSSGSPTGDALYFTEENVTATAGSLLLYCYERCLKPDVTQAQADAHPYDPSADSAFFSFDATDPLNSAHEHIYTYSSANMTLKMDGQAAGLASGVSASKGLHSLGIRSGPYVTSASAQPFLLYEADSFYEWETGQQKQNQASSLFDTEGHAVAFDSPLFLDYEHSLANDRSGAENSLFADRPYLLTSAGFGDLRGFPSAMNAQGAWAQRFALKDGSLLGSSEEYKAKALQGELMLKEKSGECQQLSLGAPPDLPSIEGWQAPAIGRSPVLRQAVSIIEGSVP